MAKRKVKTITYLCPQERDKLVNLAKDRQTSISDIIRQLIQNHATSV